MIPILYEAGETSFTSMGLGGLYDCISCHVEEERNGEFELELEYPENGLHYSEIQKDRIILAQTETDQAANKWQPFIIYSISLPITGKISVQARHVSYLLNYRIVKPFSATGIVEVFSKLGSQRAFSDNFTFTVDSSMTSQTVFEVADPCSIRSVLGGSTGSVLDVYGGEYTFDRTNVKISQNRGSNNGVRLMYGKNITDFTQDTDVDEVITGVFPFFGNDSLYADCAGYSGYDSTKDGTFRVASPQSAYPKIVAVNFASEFGSTPTEVTTTLKDNLGTLARSWLAKSEKTKPSIDLKVSFVNLGDTEEYKDLKNLETVKLCDTVTVYIPRYNINKELKVIKTNFNVLKERYDSIEVGEVKSNFSSTISNIQSQAQSCVTDAELSKQLDDFRVELGGSATTRSTTSSAGFTWSWLWDNSYLHTGCTKESSYQTILSKLGNFVYLSIAVKLNSAVNTAVILDLPSSLSSDGYAGLNINAYSPNADIWGLSAWIAPTSGSNNSKVRVSRANNANIPANTLLQINGFWRVG